MTALEYVTGAEPPQTRIDLTEAKRFFGLMSESENPTFQTFDDTGAQRPGFAHVLHGDVQDHVDRLTELNQRGAGVFWTVNHTDGKGRKAENVTAVRAVFLDLDGAPLEPALTAGAVPHAVIESSPGKWHVYWLVSGCPLAQFSPIQLSLAAKFGGDRSVHDLSRVLRVPGFVHRKGEPFMSRVVSLDLTQPYEISDLLERLGLDLLAVPSSTSKSLLCDPETGEVREKIAPGGRHAYLVKWAAQLNWRGMPIEAIRVAVHLENQRACEPAKSQAEVDGIVNDIFSRYANQHGRDIAQARQGEPLAPQLLLAPPHKSEDGVVPRFADIDLSNLATLQPKPQDWYWDSYLPAGHVTLLGAHGGTGKSTLALMLAASISTGREFLGRRTHPAKVLFFSGEDPADLVKARLSKLVSLMNFDLDLLLDNLFVVDATDFNPVLFTEARIGGVRTGMTTPTYDALAQYVDTYQIDVVIADNASDVFDGEEINRAMVRAFIRYLTRLVRKRNGAVLLLAHVDKATSRGGRSNTNTESYSGSTAWHNSVRSRIFLVETAPGELEMQHQKSNLGRKQAPLVLTWDEGGLPQLVADVAMLEGGDDLSGSVAHRQIRSLLELIHEFCGRGESVPTGPTSPTNAFKLFQTDRNYPAGLKRPDLFARLRDAERAALIERQDYQSSNRKQLQRWKLTPRGHEYIGAAPTATSAPTAEDGSESAVIAESVRQARQPAAGGYGGRGASPRTARKTSVGRPTA